MNNTDNHLSTLCSRYPALTGLRDNIAEAAEMIISCYNQGGKLLVCGNGGSCADAEHLTAELMKSFEKERPLDQSFIDRLCEISPERGRFLGEKLSHALPAIPLTSNTALTTAVSNDTDSSLIFAQQLIGYGNEGDILIGLSTSGNSVNVIDACITARALNMNIIGFTGSSGGKMKQFCDILINVPETRTAWVQELLLPAMHTVCLIVEDFFYS